ncbi:hypothetical protein BC827DRAFT_1155663 [Russula dissimulans]|nr:hypothetical protein BC827DRAFT_1155663 [Russula dissimulans]
MFEISDDQANLSVVDILQLASTPPSESLAFQVEVEADTLFQHDLTQFWFMVEIKVVHMEPMVPSNVADSVFHSSEECLTHLAYVEWFSPFSAVPKNYHHQCKMVTEMQVSSGLSPSFIYTTLATVPVVVGGGKESHLMVFYCCRKLIRNSVHQQVWVLAGMGAGSHLGTHTKPVPYPWV